ncbi:hypothetical protein VU07_04020, partial [Desulfobulbus sp. F4]|nr:hypothetical protein [Desulfobulbus sp. F4]
MSSSAKNDRKTVFDLKGAAFTIPVLSLRRNELDELAAQLAEKIRQAPDFSATRRWCSVCGNW